MSRVLLAGNNEAACLVLDVLLEALPPSDVLAVVPPGGVHHAWQPSLERHAVARGVPVLAPLDVNDDATVAAVAGHRAELLLSVYYTQLFGERLLAALEGPAVNFHPSLLPRHRGVAPLIWAIAEGDSMTGVTAHHIDAGIDIGRVVAQRKLPIHPDDTGHTLHRKAARLVSATAAELLRGFLTGRADHLFWLGAAIADAVAGLRQPAVELATARRGVPADRAILLPIPVHPVERTMSLEEAQAQIGVDPDTTVLLTVAMPYKYAPVVRPSFFDAAVPLVAGRPDCVLLAVGPEPTGPWAQAAEATGGRVRALGVQHELAPYYHAATLYLDSYPFSSNTALIEAAGHAVPVLSFSPDPERQGVLLSHDPGIESLIVRASTPDAYRAAGDALLGDLEAAAALGERSRAGIERAHSGPGWLERLERAYATAAAAGPAALMPPSRQPEIPADWEAISASLFAHAGQAPSLTTVAGAHRVAAPGVAPDLPEAADPRPWDAVAVVDTDPAAVGRALDALVQLHGRHTIARLAVAVAPAALDVAVPAIEDWLGGRPDIDLDLFPVEDPGRLVSLGTVLVLASGDPLAAAARRRGVAVVEA